jgi:hypothetical protein
MVRVSPGTPTGTTWRVDSPFFSLRREVNPICLPSADQNGEPSKSPAVNGAPSSQIRLYVLFLAWSEVDTTKAV